MSSLVTKTVLNKSLHKQFAKFAIVGFSNTLIDWTVYFLITRFITLFSDELVLSKAISFIVAVTNSFYWNRRWTFESQSVSNALFIPFLIVNIVSLIINTGALFISMQLFSINELTSLIIATSFTLIWNFTGSKFIVFRKENKSLI